jgi:catechol-2,3-dioxygenase
VDLNHLHLHVRELEPTAAFYREHFGFAHERRLDSDLLFLHNDDGFAFALVEDAEAPEMPSWFHIGFALGSAEDVQSMHRRLAPEADLDVEDGYVSFRVADPSGTQVEVYWEDVEL